MAAGVFLAVLTAAAPAAPARAWGHQLLRNHCLQFAGDANNAWALAHGICAFGATFLANDGRRAAEVITADFLRKNPEFDGGRSSGSRYQFQQYAADGTPIEPHPNLLVKTLVLSGEPPTTRYPTAWGEVTLAELVASVKLGFRHRPQDEAYWREVGWTLDLFSHLLEPGKPAMFQTSDGKEVTFNRVMDDALGYLESSQLDLKLGIQKGLPQVNKRKQGIYAHSCGGLHLVQAVFSWSRFAEVKRTWGKRLDNQLAILFYRLDSERRQYEVALAQAPRYRLQILTQMVKFYGHFLETTARLKDETGWIPTPLQKQTIDKAKGLLEASLRQLEADQTFTQMAQIRKHSPQIYLDLVGDACHASHGWDGWR